MSGAGTIDIVVTVPNSQVNSLVEGVGIIAANTDVADGGRRGSGLVMRQPARGRDWDACRRNCRRKGH